MTDEPFMFFLSYAREDRVQDSGGTIKGFHDDLVEAVRVRTSWRADRVGLIETTALDAGVSWPKQLSAALASCRAFVPVLSPTYFSREFCGKEWAVFASRLDDLPQGPGGPPALIRPVQLVAPRYLTGMPAVVEPVQRTHDSYGDQYNTKGLRTLRRLDRAAYEAFVEAFADGLVAAVTADELPRSQQAPDIEAVASAFQRPGTHLAATRPEAAPAGPKYVQFFYVAARKSELTGVRDDLQFYGDEGGLDWRPYLPDPTDAVGFIAQAVSAQEELYYEARPVDDGLISAIREALDRNKIVVMLVDSWTVRLRAYQQLMAEVDRLDLDNCVVVIPWNSADSESAKCRDLLVKAVQATFVNKARRRDPLFVDSPASYTEFKDELAKALVAARGRILESTAVIRRAESAGAFVESEFALPPSL